MTTQEYIMDERFKVHGVGLARENGDPIWVPGGKCDAALRRVVPTSTVVVHNASFDVAILAWRYGLRPLRIIDTVSLSRALIGSRLRKHSLDNCAKVLLGRNKSQGLAVSMGKWELTPEEERTLAYYCALGPDSDVNLCRSIFKAFQPHIPAQELPLIDWCARAFTEPKLILDSAHLENYHKKVVAEKQAVLDRTGLENRDVLMSNPKFAEALIALGVTPPMKISKTTGKESFALAKTDEGLTSLLEHENPSVQALVAARLGVKSTIEETRAATYHKASLYGSWPIHYNYSGANQTHRFSGSNGAGGNPQNLKRGGELRNAIMAPDGYTLVSGDLSQIELRITLALAGEKVGLDKLRYGQDLYSWFGEIMYGYEVWKGMNERQIAKSAVLGCGFGMGKHRFYDYCIAMGIQLTQEEAEKAVALYRATFPGVVRLWRMAERALHAALDGSVEAAWPPGCEHLVACREPLFDTPAIRLPNGLHIKYPGLEFDAENRQWSYESDGKRIKIFGGLVVENCVQALARNINMGKLIEINKYMPVVMTTHDDNTAIVKEDKAEIGRKIIAKIMSSPVEWWPDLPLGVEVNVGKRYGEME